MATRSGYTILIKGFVPVDPKDLSAHRRALDAIDLATKSPSAAEEGKTTTDALFRLMEVETFDVRPVQRRGEQS